MLGIAVISPNEMWAAVSSLAVGTDQAVAHTSNAGMTWDVVDTGNGSSPKTVFFIDDQHGWLAGNSFQHTTDGGKTWIKDNNWGSVYDLYFIDTQNGWGAGNGGITYRTTNGGLNWQSQAVPNSIVTLSSIWFTDSLNGWTVNISGEIFRTTNGGQSWALSYDTNKYLSTIQFFDAQEGWAIGGDSFFHTVDGGATWNKAAVPSGTWSHGARFYDRLNGVSVGETGNIVRTENGGVTWTQIAPMGSGPDLWDVEYGDADTVFYSGESGALAKSSDGGLTWGSIQSGGAGATHAIDILDAKRAWAGNDEGEVLTTTNGGKKWVRHKVTGFDVYGHINGVDFVDANNGWAVGMNSTFGPDYGRISRSTDGGHSWALQVNEPWVEFLGVSALDSTIALAYGYEYGGPGIVRRTVDGGTTWTEVLSTGGQISGGFFINATTGWVVGVHIWKTTDGGATFTKQFHNTSGWHLYDVSFADTQNGWAVGEANQVLRTTDGGQTWAPQTIPAPPQTFFFGVSAVGPWTAWVVGSNGTVARTLDGGQTWQNESIPAGGPVFECAEFIDANTGWVGGYTGIYKRARVRG
jgi:photosystem II stability/assembly factor-like uncharacterized protein